MALLSICLANRPFFTPQSKHNYPLASFSLDFLIHLQFHSMTSGFFLFPFSQESFSKVQNGAQAVPKAPRPPPPPSIHTKLTSKTIPDLFRILFFFPSTPFAAAKLKFFDLRWKTKSKSFPTNTNSNSFSYFPDSTNHRQKENCYKSKTGSRD